MGNFTSRAAVGEPIASKKLPRTGGKGKGGILLFEPERRGEIGNNYDTFEKSRNQAVSRAGGTDNIGRPAESALGEGEWLQGSHRHEIACQN